MACSQAVPHWPIWILAHNGVYNMPFPAFLVPLFPSCASSFSTPEYSLSETIGERHVQSRRSYLRLYEHIILPYRTASLDAIPLRRPHPTPYWAAPPSANYSANGKNATGSTIRGMNFETDEISLRKCHIHPSFNLCSLHIH